MKSSLLFAVSVSVALSFMLLACSDRGGYSGEARLPDPPSNPGSIEQLTNTVWETPTATLAFYPGGVVSFQPKGEESPKLTGSYSLNNGIVMATIMGVEPIAATWDGKKLVIQGIECTPRGRTESQAPRPRQ